MSLEPTSQFGPLLTAMVTPFTASGAVDYARAEATLDTSSATVQQSFGKLQKLVAPWMKG